MILAGSYQSGFAPRDGRPLYPELWRGCVGAWAPCLGPTGLTLRDWSGLGNGGTLTNMEGSDWVIGRNLYALDFDGVNEYVDCGLSTVIQPTTQGTICCFVRPSTTAGYKFVISWANGDTDRNGVQMWLQPTSNGFRAEVCSAVGVSLNADGTAGSVAVNRWTHLAFLWNGTTQSYYVDGVRVYSMSQSVVPTNGVHPLRIGAAGSTTAYCFAGSLDDARVYSLALSPNVIKLLSSRRGIAYELAPRRRSSVAVAAFHRRRRLLVGASS